MNREQLTAKWEECLAIIKRDLNNETAFATWFEPTVARAYRDNYVTIRVPSMFCKELYETKYFPVFSKALHTVFDEKVKVIYEVPVAGDGKEGSVKLKAGKAEKAIEEPKTKSTMKNGGKGSEYIPQLNSAMSFENYCVSPCNKLPWTIAESIARHPLNSNFNPFFLYGDVGVGKTHLMQAIGLKVRQEFPDKKVVFLPMREFQRLYQNAYLNSEIPAFLQWFMGCDVLLFDDLQEVAGRGSTLNNALFPIFNHLQHHGKQLVFTCDRPPQDLKDLEDRLIDRFKWGIVEKLERPDQALRKKILTFKARKNGLNLPPEVIDYIAATPFNSVREIEGIVLSMMTRAINLGLEIDLQLARQVVGRAVSSSNSKAINFDMIVESVAEQFKLNSDVIFSKSRVKDVAEARMVIMYLAHKVLNLSSGSIGLKLGRKHSTVIYGIKNVEERVACDREYAAMLDGIEQNL